MMQYVQYEDSRGQRKRGFCKVMLHNWRDYVKLAWLFRQIKGERVSGSCMLSGEAWVHHVIPLSPFPGLDEI
jgi:hypothetical protein